MTAQEIITQYLEDDEYAPPEYAAKKLIESLREAGFGIARHGETVPLSIRECHNVVFTSDKE